MEVNISGVREAIWGKSSHARMIKEIMLVPLPLAASRRLMSFLTFHISICTPYGQPVSKASPMNPTSSLRPRKYGLFARPLTLHPLCGRGAAQWRGTIPRHNRGKNWKKAWRGSVQSVVWAHAALTLRSASVAWGSLMLTMALRTSLETTGENKRRKRRAPKTGHLST